MQPYSGFKIRLLLFFVLLTISQVSQAQYIELEPPFVVNLASDSDIKFAQVSVQVSVEGDEAAKALATHTPAIRHAMVMLISSKTEKDVGSRDGKQKLREEALQAIRTVMVEQHVTFTPPEPKEEKEENTEKDKKKKEGDHTATYSPIKDVFFTRFIIQ